MQDCMLRGTGHHTYPAKSAKRSLDLESFPQPLILSKLQKKIKIDEPLSPHTVTGAATKIDLCASVTAISPMKNKRSLVIRNVFALWDLTKVRKCN